MWEIRSLTTENDSRHEFVLDSKYQHQLSLYGTVMYAKACKSKQLRLLKKELYIKVFKVTACSLGTE